jgi:predicted DNA-binding antitoxin AbrB/MazE fold protein
MQQTIRAVYEDGVLRPLEPINLPDQQVVELHIQTAGEQRRIAHLGGSRAAYISGDIPSFEEIQDLTHIAKKDCRL